MNSYIVRIYRAEKDRPRHLVGIVEEVGKEDKRAFTNIDDLWSILNSSASRKGQRVVKMKKRRKP